MAPPSIDAKTYVIGAADIWYRPVGVLTPWVSIGASIGNIVFRVKQTRFNPSDQFNGLLALVREMDYISKQNAECEFEMPSLTGPNLALAMAGEVTTVTLSTDRVGTPWSTTMAAASIIGDTNIKVTAITTIAVGDWVRFDAPGALAEFRQLTFLGTAGSGGTGISFRDPLLQAHANGVAVVAANGDGKTELTPGIVRRIPLVAYNDFALVAQSPASYYELILRNAITETDPVEMTMGDTTMAAIKVVLGTRKDGLNLATPDWVIRVP